LLEHLAALPPLELAYSDEPEAELPRIVGGLSVALARSFNTVDPKLKHPATRDWKRAFQLFDLLLSGSKQAPPAAGDSHCWRRSVALVRRALCALA
jgi:hypothetical protein